MSRSARSTRLLENVRPVLMVFGALAAALAGTNVVLMFAIAAMTTLLTIRLYAMARPDAAGMR